jgi:hypothetical protein
MTFKKMHISSVVPDAAKDSAREEHLVTVFCIRSAPVEGRAVYQMNKSRDTSHRVHAMGMIRITKSHYIHRCLLRGNFCEGSKSR